MNSSLSPVQQQYRAYKAQHHPGQTGGGEVNPQFYTVSDLARRWKVSTDTVRREVGCRKLAAVREEARR